MNLANLNPIAIDLTYLERLAALSSASTALRRAEERLLYTYAVRHYEHGQQWFLHPKTIVPRALLSFDELRKNSITVPDLIAYLTEVGKGKDAITDVEDAEAKVSLAAAACREVEDEYESRPWPRYWLVTSSDGHIHRSTHCSTCNKGKSRTGFALAAYLSGKSDADAVADLGPALCSVCYPDAPVESKEQTRISARLALTLAEDGCEAFHKARKVAAEKASERAASLCPGSGEQGTPSSTGSRYTPHHLCPVCGESSRQTSTGKVRPHRAPIFYVENSDYKCWSPDGWVARKKAYLFKSIGEAKSVASTAPGASVRRK